jgi:hypothetical protein
MLSACPCFCLSPCVHECMSSCSACCPLFILPLGTCVITPSVSSRLMFLSLTAAIAVVLHTLLRLLCPLLRRVRSRRAVNNLLFGSTAPRLNPLPVETRFGCVTAVGTKGDAVIKPASSIHRLLNHLRSNGIHIKGEEGSTTGVDSEDDEVESSSCKYNCLWSTVVNDSKRPKQISVNVFYVALIQWIVVAHVAPRSVKKRVFQYLYSVIESGHFLMVLHGGQFGSTPLVQTIGKTSS